MPPASNPQTAMPAGLAEVLAHAAEQARQSGVFGEVDLCNGLLDAAAKASAEPASFRLSFEGGKLWVSLVTANRWLSQSIEADLVHTGDKLEDLIHEELVDLGYTGKPVPFEHFRSEDKLFTFRSIIPANLNHAHPTPEDKALVTTFLLGYEAAFRNLGDMEEKED